MLILATDVVAECIGCGCTDINACAGGCWWLRVDRALRKGVCSHCRHKLVDWDRLLTAAARTEDDVDDRSLNTA